MKEFKVNDRVKAMTAVMENPSSIPNPNARPLDDDWIHANIGELGTVVHVESGVYPTVRFDRTGTATMVSLSEVELIDTIV